MKEEFSLLLISWREREIWVTLRKGVGLCIVGWVKFRRLNSNRKGNPLAWLIYGLQMNVCPWSFQVCWSNESQKPFPSKRRLVVMTIRFSTNQIFLYIVWFVCSLAILTLYNRLLHNFRLYCEGGESQTWFVNFKSFSYKF